MSQWSDHEFWHCKTTFIEWFWINVYPNSFFDKNIIGRRIHNGLWSWLNLCNQSPCAYEQLNVLNGNFLWRFCDVFVDTIPKPNPWNCLVLRQWFDHEVNAITSFVRMEFRIQDWADLRIWTNPPPQSGCCEVSRLSVLSTCCLHNLRSFFNRNEELSFLNFLLRKQLLSTVSTISDHQEVLRISGCILATSFPVSMMLSSDVALALAI